LDPGAAEPNERGEECWREKERRRKELNLAYLPILFSVGSQRKG